MKSLPTPCILVKRTLVKSLSEAPCYLQYVLEYNGRYGRSRHNGPAGALPRTAEKHDAVVTPHVYSSAEKLPRGQQGKLDLRV
jgi:hypothetical protein